MRRPNCIPTAYLSSSILLVCALGSLPSWSQQVPADTQPIGHTSAKEVQVAGAVEVHDGEMLLGNGSAITAGAETVNISLTRGGKLRLCSTTAVHLSHDRTIEASDSSALMMALDRGALETDYETGKYSDVLLTPDLRILISPPGHADIRIRVNARGDTCVDNKGLNAPYITVTSQFDGGLYRLTPNQHVTFERGSLKDVVDTESEPCGCPAPVSAASSVASAVPAAGASVGKPVGGPSSTPADTTFPLAESEGLAPAPPLPTTPVAKPGEVHVQVTVPLSYNGETPVPPHTDGVPSATAAPDTTTNQETMAATDAPTTVHTRGRRQESCPCTRPGRARR